eukprot:scaffold66502_cov52-Phaeocystis_antarctica.AAC.2
MPQQQCGGCSGGEGMELARVWWPRPGRVLRGMAQWVGGSGGLLNVCLLPALLDGAPDAPVCAALPRVCHRRPVRSEVAAPRAAGARCATHRPKALKLDLHLSLNDVGVCLFRRRS